MYKKRIPYLILLAALLIGIDACAPKKQVLSVEPAQAELQTDEISEDEVIVTVGSKTLTMRQIKYLQPRIKPARLKSFTDWWIQSLLLFEEAKKRGGILDNPALQFKVEAETRKIYNSNLIGKIRNAVTVNEEQIKQYYADNKETDNILKTPAKYDFSLITTKTLKKAEDIIRKINEGADITSFTTKAADGSETKKARMFRNRTTDYITKRHGRKFLAEISKTQKGNIIGPLQNPQKKYNIARLEEKHQKIKPFNEVKDQIKRKLTRIKQREAVNNLLDSLKENNADKIHLSPHYLEYTEKLEEEKSKKIQTNPN